MPNDAWRSLVNPLLIPSPALSMQGFRQTFAARNIAASNKSRNSNGNLRLRTANPNAVDISQAVACGAFKLEFKRWKTAGHRDMLF
jgi:hypothetical protein